MIAQEANERYFIGLMSGTSLDAIDAALVSIGNNRLRLVAHEAFAIADNLRDRISALFEPSDDEIDRLGELDRELGVLSAECVNQLLSRSSIPSDQVCAIGSHGQTIRHRPAMSADRLGFSLQIADPSTIAALTGITTVADFRKKDVALGGQGAPLAPVFHAYLCSGQQEPCGVLNIGGIANISVISPNNEANLTGFDIGPGNGLMDAWIQKNKGLAFDLNGEWAERGHSNETLLNQLMSDKYFAQAAPKSTGKEYFNMAWLESNMLEISESVIPIEDVQATLLELTARSITDACKSTGITTLYLCGGGALNHALVKRLQSLLNDTVKLKSSEVLGIDPMWVEACAFAWLAQQTIDSLPSNRTEVTGASRRAILGGIFLP